MGEANQNRSTASADATATTATPSKGPAGITNFMSDGAQTQAVAAAQSAKAQFTVDGKSVSEEAWLKAASENGYDIARLPLNYRPDISTKKHGE